MTKDKTFTAARTICAAESGLYKKVGTLIKPDFNIKNKSMILRQDINEKCKVFSADVFRSNHGIANEKFLGDKIAGVITSKVCGLDIDDIIDFEIVECLIKHKAHLINEYFKDITELIKENLNEILSLRHERSLKSDNSYVTSGGLHLEKLLLSYTCAFKSEETS